MVVAVLAAGMVWAVPPLLTAFAAMGVYFVSVATYELAVLRVHRRDSTGLDWSLWRERRFDRKRVLVKLVGLFGSCAVVVGVHWLFRIYDPGQMELAGLVGLVLSPLGVGLAVGYVLVIDTVMVRPEDGYWHVGNLFLGRFDRVERGELREHALAWTIKGLFLPIMFVYLVGTLGRLQHDIGFVSAGYVPLVRWLVDFAAAVELTVVCVGYSCTLRLFDAHIRSSHPFLLGWLVTLACYEPFNKVVTGTVLRYNDGHYWFDSFGDVPLMAIPWGAALLASFVFWLWATTAFGLRWSNLTHRGIVTNGPYRFTKHPDYLSKSIFFWLVNVPFLSTAGVFEAVQGSLMLAGVNLIYYGRAKMEERHLSRDPAYRAYAAAIRERGLFRFLPGLAIRLARMPNRVAGGRRVRFWLPVGAALALAGGGVLNIRSGAGTDVRDVVTTFMARHHIAGAVVAYGPVGGKPVVQAFGELDPLTHVPMRPDLRFHVASLSKPLTAAAVFALRREGRLALDERLADIFPEVARAADARYGEITVRHLLQHTAGFDRIGTFDPMLEPEAVLGRGGADVDVCDGIAEAMLERPLQYRPGTTQVYSNLGYCWLGRIVARRAGMPYEEYVRQQVLAPLGLRCQIGERGLAADGLAQGYLGSAPRPQPLPHDRRTEGMWRRLGAAGGWVCSAEEYFRFASQTVDPEALVPPSSVPSSSSFYGLGWRVWPTRHVLTHSGFMPGVFSLTMKMADQWVVVALFNGGVDDGLEAFGELFEGLSRVNHDGA